MGKWSPEKSAVEGAENHAIIRLTTSFGKVPCLIARVEKFYVTDSNNFLIFLGSMGGLSIITQ